MGNVGLPEILVIAVIGLLVFGPRRLPEMARNAGRALHEIKRITGELTDELKAGLDEAEVNPASRDHREFGSVTGTEMLPIQRSLGESAQGEAGRTSGSRQPKEAPPGKDV